jgi:AcrR family transcriptional regulator
MPAVIEPTTRDAILARAVDLASEEGLEGLTIGRLATELEMSKSGLFGHFGSKRDLQLATIDAASLRFIEEVVVPTAELEDGEPRLRALCDRYIGYMEKQLFPGGCFWATVTTEFDNRPGPVRDEIKTRMGAWIGLLREQAQVAGAADPDQLVFELHSIAQGANSAFQMFEDERAFTRARAAIERSLARL